jgi:hypothetical protein
VLQRYTKPVKPKLTLLKMLQPKTILLNNRIIQGAQWQPRKRIYA